MPPPRFTASTVGKSFSIGAAMPTNRRRFSSNSSMRGPVPRCACNDTMGSLAAVARARSWASASYQMPCFDEGPPVSQDCTWPWPKPGFTRTAIGPA